MVGLDRLKQDECLDIMVPRKKRRVQFSETSSCRPLVLSVRDEKENKSCIRTSSNASSPLKIRNSVPFEDTVGDRKTCPAPCSVQCPKGGTSEMSSDSDETELPDFEIPTKRQDGPSSVAQVTDALVLHYLMKDTCEEGFEICAKAEEIAEDEIDEDTSSSDQPGLINTEDNSTFNDQIQTTPTNLAECSACPLDTDLWPHVCARLQSLARRLATTGKASLLPSTSRLRPQHLPTIQFLASTIGLALGGNEQDPALAALDEERASMPTSSLD